MTQEEKKIFDMQSSSYKAAMAQTAEERALYAKTAIAKEAQCRKEDDSVDLNVREITEKQYTDYQNWRYRRGAAFEEVRTTYLTKMAAEGKIHHSLLKHIETNHVMPPDAVKERAIRVWMGELSVKKIKEKFREIMGKLFKPQHAEIVAQEMKKLNEE